MCRDKDRRLLFRGWNRLCLHAASLNVAEGALAAATAVARAARAKAEQEETAAAVSALGAVKKETARKRTLEEAALNIRRAKRVVRQRSP